MLNEKISTSIVGLTGFTASAVTPDVLNAVVNEQPNLVNVVTQLVILVATIVGLFKKKVNKN